MMINRHRFIIAILFLLFIVNITGSSIIYAEADITDRNALGGLAHYNGIIFDYFESERADIEGALAVGEESSIGTMGQFDIGAAAAPNYSQVAIGQYDNPNGYPTLLLGGLPTVGNATASNIYVHGGPLVLSEDLRTAYLNQTNQIRGATKFAESSIVDAFFTDAYSTSVNTVNVLANAQQNSNASITVSDFTGYSIYNGFKTNLSDFEADNLNTGATGISPNDVLAINIIDSGHLTINSPQITGAFGDYEMIIFNFPNATSVDFTGGSVAVDGTQLNTSAPGYWMPNENALLAKYSSKIVWNFPVAKAIEVYASGIVGSVLAPDAYVDGTGGSINGMLIADTFIMANGHELHAFMINSNIFDFTNEAVSLSGSVILYKVDADNNNIRLPDAVFRLEVWNEDTNGWLSYSAATDSLTTDQYGQIKLEDLPAGRYRFVEISPPGGYQPSSSNPEFTIDESNGVDTAVIVTAMNSALTIDATILKLSDSSAPLEGASFALYRLEDDHDVTLLIAPITTNSSGQAVISGLTVGTYYLMEYEPPQGFGLDPLYDVIKIVVTQNINTGNLEIQFFNTEGNGIFPNLNGEFEIVNTTPVEPRLIFAKIASVTGARLSGAWFSLDVYNTTTDEWEAYSGPEVSNNPLETDSYGYIIINGLPDGDYRLVETTPPAGYEITGVGEFTFTITNGLFNGLTAEYIITAENTEIEGSLEIQKSDSTSGAAIAGAQFTLYRVVENDSLELITVLTTDKNGRAFISGLAQETYWLEETKIPSGYLPINPSGTKFIVGNDGTETFIYDHVVAIENEAILGSVQLTKLDGDSGNPLSDVVFELYKLNPDTHTFVPYRSSLVTDTNGQLALITGLPLGTYKFLEIENPNTGYESGHPLIFSITDGGVLDLTITMENFKAQFPSLKIFKVDYDDHSIVLPGAKFMLYRSDTGDFQPGGAYEVFGSAISDEYGKIVFPYLIKGHYRLLEVLPPYSYILTGQEVLFEVWENESGALRISIEGIDVTDHMYENLYILNRQDPVINVDLKKVDANDHSIALPGAEFDVYFSTSGTEDSYTVYGTTVSDHNGLVRLENLRAGFYRLIEAKAPDGYELAFDSLIEFEIRLVDDALVVYFNGRAATEDDLIIENKGLADPTDTTDMTDATDTTDTSGTISTSNTTDASAPAKPNESGSKTGDSGIGITLFLLLMATSILTAIIILKKKINQ